MSSQHTTPAQILLRAGIWAAVLFVPVDLWNLTARYLVLTCGAGSSFGGGCSAPGLGHYYALLGTVVTAAAVLVPLATFKLALVLRDAWRTLRRWPRHGGRPRSSRTGPIR